LHPQRDFISPDDFIPSAEESGAILAIGTWVIEEACRQAASWRDPFPHRVLAISVNLSAKQFSNGAEPLDQIRRNLQACAL
jgi:EAL domain-containing protein (putative c-di-GMP-specific phosphodiesterase class I)